MGDWLGSLYFVIKVVAVLFGALGGAFVGTMLAPLLVGDSKRKRLPVVFGCAALGGFALWLAMTRVGGGGGPGPGGPGAGGYTGGNEESDAGSKATRKKPAAPLAVLRVHLLGGQRVKEDRFYVIDGGSPLNWEELVEAIAARRKQDRSLKTIDIVIHPDSVDRENPAVLRLQSWAKDHDLTPTLSLPKE
jgi:hypothetical protein